MLVLVIREFSIELSYNSNQLNIDRHIVWKERFSSQLWQSTIVTYIHVKMWYHDRNFQIVLSLHLRPHIIFIIIYLSHHKSCFILFPIYCAFKQVTCINLALLLLGDSRVKKLNISLDLHFLKDCRWCWITLIEF